eukprot:140000-Amphidinium_carterae.1
MPRHHVTTCWGKLVWTASCPDLKSSMSSKILPADCWALSVAEVLQHCCSHRWTQLHHASSQERAVPSVNGSQVGWEAFDLAPHLYLKRPRLASQHHGTLRISRQGCSCD